MNTHTHTHTHSLTQVRSSVCRTGSDHQHHLRKMRHTHDIKEILREDEHLNSFKEFSMIHTHIQILTVSRRTRLFLDCSGFYTQQTRLFWPVRILLTSHPHRLNCHCRSNCYWNKINKNMRSTVRLSVR